MIGKKLKELRISRKLTIQNVADQMDVSVATISLWESEQRKPDLEGLKKISKLFNISIDWLLDNDDNNINIKLPKNENSITLIGKSGELETYSVDDNQIKALQMFADTLLQTSKKK